MLDLAVEQQIAVAEQAVTASATRQDALAIATRAVLYHQNTRVLVALCQSTDQDPTLRELFNKLSAGVVSALTALMTRLGYPATSARVDLLHSLIVGLSILALATGRDDAGGRTTAALTEALNLLSTPESAEGARP